MPSAATEIGRGGHVVELYRDDSQLAETIGGWLVEAVRADAVAVVIATEPHRRLFLEQLAAAGVDVALARRRGTLVLLDAAATLARFAAAGAVDARAFMRVVGSLVRDAAQTRRPVRAYGEMVALLWDRGNRRAACELERLWDDLVGEVEFSLRCGYRHASVAGIEHRHAFGQVCRLHTAVLWPPLDAVA
jgi:hypothetical protein